MTERPVVSAGQYGMALNQIVFTVDPTTHEVLAQDAGRAAAEERQHRHAPFNYPADPATAAIVAAAVAAADVAGGRAARPDRRSVLAGQVRRPATENRGGESTLGNLVAEVQRWATQNAGAGSAQIAFMNPGGLRDGHGRARHRRPFPKTITYRQAANVQPFANTLVNMDLTGAQIKAALEQQWQPRRSVAAVPAAGRVEGLRVHLRPGDRRGRSRACG